MASNFLISRAAHIVRQGGIIAYPTDTIYGLGCDPYNSDAVASINDIKQRPRSKQFILLAGDIDQIASLVELDEDQQQKITQTAEPTSWVIEARPTAPAWLKSESGTITIRLTQQHDVQRLCLALGHAIISTSANPSGKRPARNSLELHKYFHHSIDMILAEHELLTASPSKVIRLCDNHVIRQ
ncbi:MAG: threonylcarbamoyl-AMP synthase [Gammaproteobacteria bacterium]|nr:threonylcarbamoyl-AMP synthase [Gammaproteobacteria bacterium]NNJ51478.1 threonylcarbamoyl-AMP synthase [Gammaproteobacteria bacterium]